MVSKTLKQAIEDSSKKTTKSSVLDDLQDKFSTTKIQERTHASKQWFQKHTRKLKISGGAGIIKEKFSGKNTTVITRLSKSDIKTIGHMVMFLYDPKNKKTLPYYDRFPLIIPIRLDNDGFLGVNLHYLFPIRRAVLLNRLEPLIVNKRKFSEKTRIRLTYRVIESLAKYKEMKPAIKKYLFNHVRSKYVKIHALDWEPAIFLPIERFMKSPKNQVWANSKTQAGI